MTKQTHEEMIEKLVLQIEDWDIDTLMEYAAEQLEKHFMSLSDEELSSVYDETFN